MRLLDLTGQRFSRLTVIKRVGSKHGGALWLCLCDCGATARVRSYDLRKEGTGSCGCLVRARNGGNQYARKHGQCFTKAYRAWASMKSRCRDHKHASYPNYGGRGISVCNRWEKFENFYADMGDPLPAMTLDRYPDNDGDYEPGNCRWATRKEQANNMRRNRLIAYQGETRPLRDWAALVGVAYETLRHRLDYLNWPIEKAIPLQEMYPPK